MAFGDLLGTLGTNAVSITNPFNATGSVAVSVGDLVFAVLSEQTTLTVTGVTDNLGNTYTAQNAGTDAGNGTGRAFYSRVTVAGTLTTVAAACTASTDNAAFAVAVFAGPFVAPPIDANPANLSNDTTTPFTCPATGTLSQSAELVVGWIGSNGSGTGYTAVSPNILAAQQISSTVATAVIGAQVVSATTSVSPAFATSVPTSNVLGTASFKKDTSVVVTPPSGYFMQFGKAAVAVAAIATQATTFAVPPNPSNLTTTLDWQQPLSTAVAVAQAVPTQPILPLPPVVAPVPAPPSGWQTIQSSAPTLAVINGSALTFVVPPFTIPGGWHHPLSRPPAIAKAAPTQPIVPLNTAQAAAAPTPLGWRSQSPSAPPVASAVPTQATSFAVPANPSNSIPSLAWQQPLSIAVPVAVAQHGRTSVPLNTAQAVQSPPPNGWFGPIQTAAKTAVAQPTQATSFAVPPSIPSTPTPGQFGWYAPLSKAAPVAQAKPGQFFVPFNTVQAPTPSTSLGMPLVLDSSAPGSTIVYYQASFKVLPPLTAPLPNTVPQLAWQQPLSVAPKLAQAAPQGASFVPFNTPQVQPLRTMAWVQPLSKPVPVAQALQGNFFVPFNTVQLSNRITTYGWYSPLSKSAPVAQASPGATFVPFDTVQVAPPPPPVVLEVPGGSSRRLDGRPWGASYRKERKQTAKVETPIALPPIAKVAVAPAPQVVVAPVVPIEVRSDPITPEDEAIVQALIDHHMQADAQARQTIMAMLDEIIAELENDEDI